MLWSGVAVLSLFYIIRVVLGILRHRALARETGLPYIIQFPASESNLLYQTVAETRLFPYVVNNWLPQWLADNINAGIFRFRWNVKDRMRKRLGGVYLEVTSGTLTCTVNDASVASQIFMARQTFLKPVEKYEILELYGPNVLTTEKSQWAHHRRHTTTSFNEKNNVLVWQETIRQTKEMLEYLVEKGPCDASRSEFVVGDVREDSLKLTLHVLCSAGFGVKLPFKPAPGATAKDVEELFRDSQSPPSGYHFTFRSVMEYSSLHPMSALIANRVIPKWIPRALLPFYDAEFKAYHDLGRYLRALVSAAGVKKAHALHNLLEGIVGTGQIKDGNDHDSTGPAISQNGGLSEAEILGNLYIFTVAGHETTATTFRYAMTLLALHQDIQSWLWEDIREATEHEPQDPVEWDYNRVFSKMIGPLCVMLETLRLYPPVVTIPKQVANSTATFTYKNEKYSLPPQTYVNINVTGVHYAEEYWGSDASMFNPRRWDRRNSDSALAKNEAIEGLAAPGLEHASIHKPVRGSYAPFSDGVRACLGKKFAQVEFVAAIAVLFRDYRVWLAPSNNQETTEQIQRRATRALQCNSSFLTLGMREGVPLLFQRRKSSQER